MKILVTGAVGQLGRELVQAAGVLGMDVIATDLPELDITDVDEVRSFFRSQAPHVVFNAAAWTAVDEAELHQERVYQINRDGAANLATVCEDLKMTLVHYSTDYVFDGTKDSSYSELDNANPINIYGMSKLASEEAVARACEKHLIFRTSWLFSEYGKNFVKTMLRLGRERTNIRIVEDQTGKPTSARELARCSLAAGTHPQATWGTYHLAQAPALNWHDFALEIFASARRYEIELKVREIVAVQSDEFPTTAKRPRNSVLDCSRFEDVFEVRIRDWPDSLGIVVEELMRDGFFA